MSRVIAGPFSRVEGDLEISLEIAEERVVSAEVNSPMYRGFEQIMQGRDPMDALVIAPRICGICSVAQSTAAATALGSAMGLHLPANGRLTQNLTMACENLADHFTHFYLYFMPDFAREVYSERSWFVQTQARFKSVTGTAARQSLPARADFLHLMGYLAGKWPHTLAIQPGGSAKSLEMAEKARMLAVLQQFRNFLEQTLFGDKLEAIAALDSEDSLLAWKEQRPATASDFRLFLEIAYDLQLHQLGRSAGRYLSYGSYPDEASHLFRPGVWVGEFQPLIPGDIAEDVSHSRMEGPYTALPPALGITVPVEDKSGAYSWCKAPRLAGQVMETGALARQLVQGHPLIRDLTARHGGNVQNRIIARLLEFALVLPVMENWVKALRPGLAFCVHGKMPEEARSFGLVEAARGSLGHWLHVHNGRIYNYQIIAPTTWNFSPRDTTNTPGALEQALVGAPALPGKDIPLAVQHIVRSFDPCMVCTVH